MITYFTIDDYFGRFLGHNDMTQAVYENAEDLLRRVNLVCEVCDLEGGIEFLLNPKTNSYVSGEKYGGFRPQDCPIGSPQSAHKQGMAVDIYDPKHEVAPWFAKHQALLKEHGLYMEDPKATPTWCHLSNRAPKSGKTIFMP